MKAILFLLGLSILPQIHDCHVSLTFPPARNYPLDFLDSARTKAPCGMPKGETRTKLKAGTNINVTWHLAYPHRGGFRLEVLDPQDRPIRTLTPEQDGNKYISSDPTAQSYEVGLPADLKCIDCSIRLVRQASEWGKKYQFWSCSDVDILPRDDKFLQTCSGRGQAHNGRCRCKPLFYGDVCQYHIECNEDKHCGTHGKCIDVKATTAPGKQCFCQKGFFGPGCKNKNPKSLSETRVQDGLYTKKELSEKVTLLWRILKEDQEIEVVIKSKGTSWVGLGWRPKGLSSSCKKFPVLADQDPQARSLNLQPEPEPESEPESEPAHHKYDDIEAEAEAEAESEPSAAAQIQEPREKRMSTRTDVGISFVMSSISSSNRNKREAQYTRRFPRAFAVPLNDEESTAEPETQPEAEPDQDEISAEPEAESEPASEPEPATEPEPSTEPEPAAEPAVEGATSWTPRGDFHAMDCTDMVIGMARGDASRISDYYTRDRSTPLRDEKWDGEDDITAAIGWERDGETTIVFRKKLSASGPTDHSIVNENMHVIWALGQDQGDYSHSPKSGLESSAVTASVPDFYHDDELKYHGKENRGVTSINFYDEIKLSLNDQSGLDFCGGEWKYPRTCRSAAEDCQYVARWEYNENTDRMNFTISSRNPDNINKWTGIGFSDNANMRQTDAIIGWVEPNGRYFIMDMWTTNYLQPILEDNQNIFDMSGVLVDGVTTISFSRPRDTQDSQDVGFTDTEGRYMIFPVKGGKYNGVNKRIKKHEEVPIVSSERIFIKPCRTADGKPTFTTTPKPPQLMYPATLKFINLGQNFNLPREGSEEFTDLQQKISRGLRNTQLRNVPGFLDVAVTKLYSGGQGEFDSSLVVIVDKNQFDADPDPLTVEEALKETVKGGKIEHLQVDAESLSFDNVVTSNDSDKRRKSDEIDPNVKLYVVVACIAALVLVAIIQASCTIFKMSRRGSSVQKEKLLGQSQWKDYSGPMGPPPLQHNYGYDGMESDDGKMGGMGGWQQHRQSYDRYSRANTHSLPRANQHQPPPSRAPSYPMGYSSFDRRERGHVSSRPGQGHDGFPPPDHYFMPSQRKMYSGESIRVYVDYNK